MTDVELPSLQAMTETISGAGIAGEYESPVLGHFQSLVLKLKWRTVTRLGLLLLAPVQHSLQLRGSIQIMDSTAGVLLTQAMQVDVRGQLKVFNPGKFEPGKPMEVDSDVEVARITIKLAGVVLVELDKFNMIFRVNGTDYLQAVRTDIGQS